MSLPPGVDAAVLAAVLAIFAAGGMVKGVLGFGLPLTTMALLPLVIPIDMALAVNIVVQPLTNLGQFFLSGAARATLARFWPMVPAMALGVAGGAALVTSLPPQVLLLILGLFVMAFTAASARGAVLPIRPAQERAAGLGTGLAAGVVGALTAANGPLFVMYLLALRIDRAGFRAALGFLFLASSCLITGGFLAVGMLDLPRALMAALCLMPALGGMWAGNRLGARLAGPAFRAAVLGGLFLLGFNFVLRGAGVL